MHHLDRRRHEVLASMLMLVACLMAPLTAKAFTFPCDESGLSAAIAAGGGPHFIEPCVSRLGIELTSTLAPTSDVQIETLFPGSTVVVSAPSTGPVRALSVPAGVTVELSGIELRNDDPAGAGPPLGGVVFNQGTLILRLGAIRGGAAAVGGGIYNAGNLTLDRVAVEGNIASQQGGGLYATVGSTTTIIGSAVEMNVSTGSDGGGAAIFGTLDATNSTWSGNDAELDGGALYVGTGATADLAFSTFAENASGGVGSIIGGGGSTTLQASILEGSCASAIVSSGHNLESPGASCGLGALGDRDMLPSTSLDLEPRVVDAGRTPAHPLGLASVARDVVAEALCPDTDQRGAPRPELAGTHCDVGAYESTNVRIRDVVKIAEQGDPDPRGSSTIDRFEITAMTQGQVAFIATDSTAERSVYLWDGISISHVAGASTPVPDGTGTFQLSGDFPQLSGSASSLSRLGADDGEFVLFYGPELVFNPVPGPGPRFLPPPDLGFYGFSDAAPIARCANAADTLPGGAAAFVQANHGNMMFDVDEGAVAWEDSGGIYTCSGGTITQRMASQVVRATTREIRTVDALQLDDGELYVNGRQRILSLPPPPYTLFSDVSGIFHHDPTVDALTLVLPGTVDGTVINDVGRDRFHHHLGITTTGSPILLVQLGATAAIVPGGLYSDASGVFERTDDTPAAYYAGSVWSAARLLDYRDGVVSHAMAGGDLGGVFPAPVPESCSSLWTNRGGVVETLIGMGTTTFDGKQATCVVGGENFTDGPDAAFAVYFDDGTNALYTARFMPQVPEPGFPIGAALGTLTLFLSRRQRGRSPVRGGASTPSRRRARGQSGWRVRESVRRSPASVWLDVLPGRATHRGVDAGSGHRITGISTPPARMREHVASLRLLRLAECVVASASGGRRVPGAPNPQRLIDASRYRCRPGRRR